MQAAFNAPPLTHPDKATHETSPPRPIVVLTPPILIPPAAPHPRRPVHDRYSNQHIHTYQQKGLTVSLDIGPLQAAQNLYQSARTIGQSRHGRTNAMAAANTGWQAYQLIDGYKGGRLLDTSNLSLSVGYGQQKNRSEVRSDLSRVQESSINAGGKTRLHATGAGQASNITVTGSDIQGAGGTLLAADNRILLQSATFGQNEESRHQSSGWNVGATARYDGKPNIGITVGGQTGHGNGHGAGESHRHSHIGNKGSQTILQSGGDTTLRGAQVAGKGIQADVQNLSIESVQDTAAYQGRQKSGGAQISAGYGGVGINGHYRQSQLDADHQSVSEQSGLYAGDDGYQIHVREKVDLIGSAIISGAEKSKNRLNAKEFSYSNIQNDSSANASSMGLGLGIAVNGTGEPQKYLTAQNPKSSDGVNLLQGARSFEINNGTATGKQGSGKYAVSKTIVQNLLNNARLDEHKSSTTQSIMSEGNFQIETQTGQQNIQAIPKGRVSGHVALEKVNSSDLERDVEVIRAFKNNVMNEVLKQTDEIYANKLQYRRNEYVLLKDANGNLLLNNDNENTPQYQQIDSQNTDLIRDKNGVVHIHINGILNGEFGNPDRAIRYSYMNGTDLAYHKDVVQYAMHEPQVPGWGGITEILGAAYDKFLNNSTLGLSSGSKQVIGYIEKYGATGLQLDVHSNGSHVVRNAVRALAQDRNNWGKYPNLRIHVTEGAANVDSLDKDLANLQGRKPNEVAYKEIVYSSNKNDNVTSHWLLGNNLPTYSSFPIGKTNNWLTRWFNLGSKTSVHNTQGIGTDEAVEQGLRGQNRPEKGGGG